MENPAEPLSPAGQGSLSVVRGGASRRPMLSLLHSELDGGSVGQDF